VANSKIAVVSLGLATYVATAAAMILRNPPAFFRAEFWAEDGPEFFADSLSLGTAALWTPVYGYQFLLSRVIACMATWMPVVWTPYVYAWLCLVLNALSVTYFVRDGFSWLIPSKAIRVVTCLVLAIAPGTPEVVGNLCNLPASLTLLGLLMLLEKPFPPSAGKVAILAVLLLSAGQMFVLTPLTMLLYWRTLHRRYVVLVVVLLLIAAGNAVGNHYKAADAGYRNYDALPYIPSIVLAQACLRAFVGPFVGPHRTGQLMTAATAIFWPALAVMGVGTAWVVSRFRPFREPMIILVFSYVLVCGTFAVMLLSRDYAFELLARESGTFLWSHRYAYLPGSIAILFWLTVVGTPVDRWKRHSVPLAVYIVALLSTHGASQFFGVYPRPDLGWPRMAAEVQRVVNLKSQGLLGQATTIEGIQAHPVFFRYRTFSVTVRP
jgi:hypothetical protein